MIATTAFVSRLEEFDRVGSTNDEVRSWLAEGIPEVCVAVADEQTAGRGRNGRSWVAPAGAAILVSLGFRPAGLRPEHAWRLAASVSLAMAEAAEAQLGLAEGTIRLKWPNDLVALIPLASPSARSAAPGPSEVRKLGGVLGEATGLGTSDPAVVVGIGLNAGWRPEAFPAGLEATMTSLQALAPQRLIDRAAILRAFLDRVEGRVAALRAGRFDGAAWEGRQVTTGRIVAIVTDAGVETVHARGVDVESGALLLGDEGPPRALLVGHIRHVRLGAV